jgi:hypothetical protein
MVAGRPIEKHSFLVSRAGLRTCGPMAMRTNSEINHASRMVTKRRFRPESLSNRLGGRVKRMGARRFGLMLLDIC